MAREISAARHLTDNAYSVLEAVHTKHIKSMGEAERSKYGMENIVKVKFNKKENCLNVHFDDGNWWHYCPDGTWY
ncbi:hypothetical protein JMA_22550 [Jeotgalibacillus malaysiensis]|uniref:Uncharacterized protein n=1 Tax=Jeotgalibacillus malaysiensis TaxID=1508404 RepID=A0A0B5ASA9_9BACL|nr:hypothetical protein [Jeotgalibacillus malaysiensis]AJD91572.1 hypothetical protein JMA_22550 [Jeotgalibacillus malaysiensis]